MKPTNSKICLHWLPIWLAIYASLLVYSFAAPEFTSYLKIFAIALNLVFAIIYFRRDQILLLALLFTLIADIFLGINSFPFGIAIFACAQFAHLCRLTPNRRLPLVYLCLVVIWLSLCLLLRFPLIIFAAAPYALFLLTNVVLAWCQSGRLGIAFTLFLFCDLCVALSYGASILIIPFALKPIFDYLAWVFYYPSQVLIANTPLTHPVKQ